MVWLTDHGFSLEYALLVFAGLAVVSGTFKRTRGGYGRVLRKLDGAFVNSRSLHVAFRRPGTGIIMAMATPSLSTFYNEADAALGFKTPRKVPSYVGFIIWV